MCRDDSSHTSELLVTLCGEDTPRSEQLFRSTYDDLRKLAGYIMERQPPQTLQATALVNEAYLKLIGGTEVDWADQRHFINTVARAMRQVLIDHARSRASDRRGGDRRRVDLSSIDIGMADRVPHDQADAIERAIAQLETGQPRWGEIVRLRFFVGLTIEQTADVMSISPALVKKEWRFARAWLAAALDGEE